MLRFFSTARNKRAPRKAMPGSTLELCILEDRLTPAGIVVIGAPVGEPPRVQVYDAVDQTLKYDFNAFDRSFRGGVQVAVGDVNGDGTPDIIAAAGPGNSPLVRVFDGLTGARMTGKVGSFLAYTAGFRGGVNVASGDVNGDGYADIITGAGPGGSPLVKAFSGFDGSLLASFMAFNPVFHGGVRVSAGDFRHQLTADIVVAAGPGGSSRIKIFAGDTQQLIANYLAFSPNYTGGVFIGTGDINHDSTIDVIAGAGVQGRATVKVFAGQTTSVISQFQADGANYPGTIRVDAVDANGDGFEDVVVGLRSTNGPVVKTFDGAQHTLLTTFSPLNKTFSGTVSVAGSFPRGRGANYELTDPVTHEIPVLERLARYVYIDATHSQYVPVTAGSINADQHVYVITHGWAPGYRDWVNKYIDTHVLKWWETAGYGDQSYPAPSPSPGADSIWMFQGYSESGVTISPDGGLAKQITDADPKAVVLAYSWIDDSATTSTLDNAIPEQAYLSEALTNINGFRMAAAIQQALGSDFDGKLHLMGHSHGSKVATLAAVALTQEGRTVDQLTTFDSPEIAATDELNASNFLWNYFPQLNVSKTPGEGTFVDNYYSAFGYDYSNMKIDGQKTLTALVDTQLFAFPYSEVYPTDPGDWHAYPPAWYAQAHAFPSNDETNGGLAWSPLLGNDPTNLASEWEQAWSRFTYSTDTQAGLTNPFFTITPSVSYAPLIVSDISQKPAQPVTSIELSLANGQKSAFQGTYTKKLAWSGIAFDYTFAGTGPGLLKIQINNFLAYYIDSRYLKPGVTQHVTMNIGWPSTDQSISIALLPPPGVASQATVTISNFKQFDVSLL